MIDDDLPDVPASEERFELEREAPPLPALVVDVPYPVDPGPETLADPEPGAPWTAAWGDPPLDVGEVPPSRFVLPVAALVGALWGWRWSIAAWRQAPDLWWDPMLISLAAGLLAWWALRRLPAAVADAGRFMGGLSPDGGPAPSPGPPAAEDGPPDSDPAPSAAARAPGPPGLEAPSAEALAVDVAPLRQPAPPSAWRSALLAPPAPGRWLPELLPRASFVYGAAASVGAAALALAVVAQLALTPKGTGLGDAGVPDLGPVLIGVALAAMALALLADFLAPAAIDDPVTAALGASASRGSDRALAARVALAAILVVLPLAFSAAAERRPPAIALLRPAPEFLNATLQPLGLALWLFGLGLLVAALREPGRGPLEIVAGWLGALRRPEGWLLVGILILGAYFRFHDLTGLPGEMTSDHTEKLNDVRTMIERGLRPVFLPGNSGREALQFYWLSLWMGPLGFPVSFQTMKVAMGVLSLASIPPMYRLGSEVGGRALGILAALFLALSGWHVLITRIALRISFAPLFVILCLWFFFRAIRTGRRNDWLVLGALAGLGLYGYTAFRPLIPVLALAVPAKLLHDRWRHGLSGERWWAVVRPLTRHILAASLVFLALVGPLARFGRDYPDAFNQRTQTRLVGDELPTGELYRQTLQANLDAYLRPNIQRALLMFNVTHDGAWFQSPVRPALDDLTAALFIPGLALALARGLRGDWKVLLLALGLPVMLATSFMAIAFPRENPSLSRASGALPMALLLAALPLPAFVARVRAALGDWLPDTRRARIAAAAVGLLVLAIPIAGETHLRYFTEYRALYDNSTHPTSEGADLARDMVERGEVAYEQVYYVGWEHGWDIRALGYLMGQPGWSDTHLVQGRQPDWSDAAEGAWSHASDPAAKLYLVGGEHAAAQLRILQEIFPAAKAERHPTRVPGKDFWSVFVPASAEGATR